MTSTTESEKTQDGKTSELELVKTEEASTSVSESGEEKEDISSKTETGVPKEDKKVSTVGEESKEDKKLELDVDQTPRAEAEEVTSDETLTVKEDVEKEEVTVENQEQTTISDEMTGTLMSKAVTPEKLGGVEVDETEESEKIDEETKTVPIPTEAMSMESVKNLTSIAEPRVPRALEAFGVSQNEEVLATTESDESPSAIEMEDIPTAKVSMASWDRKDEGESSSLDVSVPHLDLRLEEEQGKVSPEGTESILSEEPEMESLYPQFDSLAVGGELKNEAPSPVSSIGTTYSQELLDMYTLNLHRIEKDVQRCDRNYWYFTPANLEKLRNIMCSYIWQHLEIGYVQGMCDLLAPLLVILDDEAMAFSCFTELMKRMNQNFPHGGAMDTHFANMRSLIQILDSELFELMHQNGDYTHFYFCYRWFLLDFKRELVYDDVFAVWETIWAAKYASSGHFVLFIALALVEIYRDIILENNMDFTDIIKFFNEMAEHHNIRQILTLARDLVCKVQTLIENK